MKKRVVNTEISVEELKKHIDNGLVSMKRSGTGICLVFEEKK